jgi:hypothetical protein
MNNLAAALHTLWVGWTNHLIKTYPDLPPDLVVSWKNAWKSFDELSPEQKKARIGWAKLIAGEMPKSKSSTPKDPRAMELAKDFAKYCQEINGFTPEINWGIEVSMIKSKLQNYSPDQLREEFYWFLNSEFSRKLGCTIKIALSNFTFNKWLETTV